ncbi:hypothetical protein [Neorhizobium petrolearium]|uniref:hypothetical protein n=1 Tax=Neorhizobium petrolearium TaxID=515361 RepID=UPI003F8061F7
MRLADAVYTSQKSMVRPILDGDVENFGYRLLGPYLVAFCIWLQMQKRTLDPNANLLFVARDGYLIKKIYRILFPDEAETAHYVLASRAANRYAELLTREKILKFLPSVSKANTDYEVLLSAYRFLGKTPWLQPNSVSTNPSTIPTHETLNINRRKINIEDIIPEIIAQSKKYREEYREYILSILSGKYPIVVDIGYRAQTQHFFSNLIQSSVGGLYLVTHKSAQKVAREVGPIAAFNGEFIAPNSSASFVNRHRYFFETILSEQRGTFLYFKDRNIPVFEDFISDPKSKSTLLGIEQGAIRFARHFNQLPPHAPPIEQAEDKLKRFLDAPHADDAALFTGLNFDDRLNGATQRFIVIPPAERKEKFALWIQGQQAIDANCRSAHVANPGHHLLHRAKIAIMKRLLTSAHFACFMTNCSLYIEQNGGFFRLLTSATRGYIKRKLSQPPD